jgi:hypothetical protein
MAVEFLHHLGTWELGHELGTLRATSTDWRQCVYIMYLLIMARDPDNKKIV